MNSKTKKNNRHDFTRETKKILASRVGWRCSNPHCKKITVGPTEGKSDGVHNVGIAAHITAAAPGGPRYDPMLSEELRKDISNAIWLCSICAKLIDDDEITYTVKKLNAWKAKAESKALEDIQPTNPPQPFEIESAFLVSLGFEIIFFARWCNQKGNSWRLTIETFLKGSLPLIGEYSSSFETLPQQEKFIVVESNSDGRIILEAPEIDFFKNEIHIIVKEKCIPTDPEQCGRDWCLHKQHEFFVKNGGIAMVSGTNSAILSLSNSLSLNKGENPLNPFLGTSVSFDYKQYKENLKVLSSLIKLEIIRLARISLSEDGKPQLHFISRVETVEISTATLHESYLNVQVSLVWGNQKKWSGRVPIYIAENYIVPDRKWKYFSSSVDRGIKLG